MVVRHKYSEIYSNLFFTRFDKCAFNLWFFKNVRIFQQKCPVTSFQGSNFLHVYYNTKAVLELQQILENGGAHHTLRPSPPQGKLWLKKANIPLLFIFMINQKLSHGLFYLLISKPFIFQKMHWVVYCIFLVWSYFIEK